MHRDLKPENVLVNSAGDVKISDFGLCRDLDSTHGQAGTFTGSMCYLAPERLKGDQYGIASDVWSLGLIVVECSKGSPAYAPPHQSAPKLPKR